MKAILIIDCGTTNLRVSLLGAETKAVCAVRKKDGGVRYTAIDGDNSRLCLMLSEAIREVMQAEGIVAEEIERILAYGMITSNLGLLEIPHLSAPASVADLHAGMRKKLFDGIAPCEIEFIPGVRNFYGAVDLSNVSAMDMMRGEETESVGLYRLLGLNEEAVFVLPGSHNKFVHLDAEGRILGCMTSISGELLDAVTHHTILSSSVASGFCSAEEYDAEFSKRGALEALRCGVGRAAFAGRVLQTIGKEPTGAVRSFLLGAVLAEDAKALEGFGGESKTVNIFVAGKAPLQQAVCDVLHVAGFEKVYSVPEESSSRMGLWGALTIAEA